MSKTSFGNDKKKTVFEKFWTWLLKNIQQQKQKLLKLVPPPKYIKYNMKKAQDIKKEIWCPGMMQWLYLVHNN